MHSTYMIAIAAQSYTIRVTILPSVKLEACMYVIPIFLAYTLKESTRFRTFRSLVYLKANESQASKIKPK